MNKTIFVIYTHVPVTKDKVASFKRYAFNTNFDVREGDVIHCPTYDTPMQVTDVLSRRFTFYDRSNGSLSDECTSTNQFLIRQLEVNEEVGTFNGTVKPFVPVSRSYPFSHSYPVLLLQGIKTRGNIFTYCGKSICLLIHYNLFFPGRRNRYSNC